MKKSFDQTLLDNNQPADTVDKTMTNIDPTTSLSAISDHSDNIDDTDAIKSFDQTKPSSMIENNSAATKNIENIEVLTHQESINKPCQNQILFDRAQQSIPGGVNSPVRAFKAVGGTPRFFSKAQGAWVWDANDKPYIDMIGSWGAMIVGHANPHVLQNVQQVMQNGFSFGAPCELEIKLAETIINWLPSIEQIRLVSSGTEACMSALRLAKGFTGRDYIIKFEGGYHGHADALLVKAGSGLSTFGHPTSAGVSADVAKYTLVLEYNNIEALRACFAEHGQKIAAVMIEPIAGNMNLVPATPEFLQALRQLCDDHQTVLIFDEVMSGFRVGLHSAQGLYQITPDLTCLGKVIGGGMPLAAFGGRKDIMQHLAPIGGVYQAGTLSGNPVAISSGLATLELIKVPHFFENLSFHTQYWVDEAVRLIQTKLGTCVGLAKGGMFGIFIGLEELPQNWQQVAKSDLNSFNRLFHKMLDRGVYLAPSAYEAGFISSMHDKKVIDQALNALESSLKDM
jgi:glutamate-1-semialdehyde 2,1-aminomutase